MTESKKIVIVTRTFNAPRALVFKAWTDQTLLPKWWGPPGFTTPTCVLDLRPGGIVQIDMRGPAGTEYDKIFPNRGAFHEIVKPERLVFSLTLQDDDGNALIEALNTVTLTEQNGKTTVTLEARVTNAAPQADVYLVGMQEGWEQSIDRLIALTTSETQ